MSDHRAELRRQWRSDCKNLKKNIAFRDWTPTTFDAIKRKIRMAKMRLNGMI